MLALTRAGVKGDGGGALSPEGTQRALDAGVGEGGGVPIMGTRGRSLRPLVAFLVVMEVE